MEGRDHGGRWRNLKQRLGFKGMGCCRATWSPTSSTLAILENHEEEEEEEEESELVTNVNVNVNVNHVHQAPSTATGMNLAMALAAERNSRDENVNVGHPATQVKTLMRLIEETDGVDWRKKRRKDKSSSNNNNNNNKKGVEDTNSNWVCCVCMERSKGAAFIPCGHTFCRVCSRELWLNRGSCPICNRSILEILDIF
ncbi:hypothetical protein CMV_001545 [Castanea mollissima]|uniref:RING-type domain-containing protein n=1 Tax=Castanea mollissima TaxID=60419 RepID=A0A8J4RKN9_9ROSI|nr:hypothetical protein CMV_001545 [Castanea mollissima]